VSGSPARDYSDLAAQSGEGKRGKRRGEGGGFIGAEGHRLRQAIKEFDAGSNSGDGFCFQGEGREVRDDPGDGVPPVSDRERGRGRYRFGISGVGRGLFRGWAGKGSPGSLFIFLFLFFSFLFLFFLFPLYLLHKCFKSTQTTFRNFLKFKVSKWDSKKQVLK
jgi:hypothetical protein